MGFMDNLSGLQEWNGNGFSKVRRASNSFRSSSKNLDFLDGWLPLPESTSPMNS
jgi:hypothetical protein